MEENNQNQQPEPNNELERGLELTKQDKSIMDIVKSSDLTVLTDSLNKVKGFSRKYTLKKLEVTDINNKEQLERLRLAISDVRTTATQLEKDKKEKSKPYRDATAYINENYDNVIDKVRGRYLDPLKSYKAEVDQKIEVAEKEEENKQEARLSERIQILQQAGMQFLPSGFYGVGSEKLEVPMITLGIVDIKPMTDTNFEMVLQQVIEKAALVNTRQAAENIRLADEKAQKEKDEAEAQQKLIDDQKKLDEANALLLQQQQEQEKEKQNLINMRLETRGEVLEAMGMVLNELFNEYQYPNSQLTLSISYIGDSDKSEWDKTVIEYKGRIAKIKEEIRDKLNKQKALEELRTKRGKELLELDLFYAHERNIWCYETVSRPLVSDERFDTLSDEEWKDEIIRVKEIVADAQAKKLLYDTRLEEITPYLLYGQKIQKEKLNQYSELEYITILEIKKGARLQSRVDNILGFGYELMDKTFFNEDAWPIEHEQLVGMTDAEFDAQLKNIGTAINKKRQEREKLAAAGDAALWNDYISRLGAVTIPVFESESYKNIAADAINYIDKVMLLMPK